jgi:hypothetical protein
MQLEYSTIAQGETLTDLEYEMVLSNVAMLRQNADALPWHVKFTQGAITINDTINPAFNYTWGAKGVTRAPSVTAKRNWQQAWTIVPEIDSGNLQKLRWAYAKFYKKDWIHDGMGPGGSVSGRYGTKSVWVAVRDLTNLTEQTLNILGAAPTTAGDRGIYQAQVLEYEATPENVLNQVNTVLQNFPELGDVKAVKADQIETGYRVTLDKRPNQLPPDEQKQLDQALYSLHVQLPLVVPNE